MNRTSQTVHDGHDLTAISTLSPVPGTVNHLDNTASTETSPQEPLPLSSPMLDIKQPLQLSQNRLLSLDLLRGLAILIMITCNAQIGETVFFILEHPAWIGFTIADTVFPSFLFITGCTLPLSIRADPNPTASSHYYRRHVLRVFRRSLIIWLLGVILNLYGLVQLHVKADLFRWPGVLNRIGFCYLVVGLMHILILVHGRPVEKPLSISHILRSQQFGFETDSKECFEKQDVDASLSKQDYGESWPWFLRVTLPYYLPIWCLIVWLICTYSVQVDGCPRRAMVHDPECSPQAYFDLLIFSRTHTYRHLAFDPEGSLSTLTSILNVWFGWFIGCTVRSLNVQVKLLTNEFQVRREARTGAGDQESLVEEVLEQESLVRIYMEHVGRWFWWGILWMFTGWVFSLGLPLSKPSWTATFAVLSSGVSQTVLSVLFYKFDVQPKIRRLAQLYLDNQGFHSNYHPSRHCQHNLLVAHTGDAEQVTTPPAGTRLNNSRALNVLVKVDYFLRDWFCRSILVVLGSMGRNAILMYMFSELLQGTCSLIPGGPADPATGEVTDLCTTAFNKTWGALDIGGWASLFYSMGFAALHVILAIFLDHKKWYFKV